MLISALVGLLVPCSSGGVAQLVAGSLIASSLLCILCASRPYLLKSDNALAIACQATIVVTLQLALYLRLVQLETREAAEKALLTASYRGTDYAKVGVLPLRAHEDISLGP